MFAQSKEKNPDSAQIVIPAAERLGNVVIEANKLHKGFGDELLIEDLSFNLPPGGIVGVIGPNGAGKTTLFRMITGQETPDDGTFKVGETVMLGYVDQSRDALGADKTVWEEISDGMDEIDLGSRTMASRAGGKNGPEERSSETVHESVRVDRAGGKKTAPRSEAPRPFMRVDR